MKRSIKVLMSVFAALVLVLGISACNSNSSSSDSGESYKIGVIQLVEHPALDASNSGFVQALDDSGITYTIDQQNAQADQSACQTIAAKLVNDGNNLILAIATPAAQAVAGSTTEIPVVGTAITDFVAAGLINDNAAPGTNVTGSSDLTPVAEQIDILTQLFPEAKTVGILFSSDEDNSYVQAELAHQACEAHGLTAVDYTISNSNEIQSVVESMVGKVDVIYSPTDNKIAAGIALVSSIATENGLAVICGEENMVAGGGLVTYSIDYYQLGYRAGEMAVRILTEGANPAEMPIEYMAAEDCTVVVNEEIASALGVDISGLDYVAASELG